MAALTRAAHAVGGGLEAQVWSAAGGFVVELVTGLLLGGDRALKSVDGAIESAGVAVYLLSTGAAGVGGLAQDVLSLHGPICHVSSSVERGSTERCARRELEVVKHTVPFWTSGRGGECGHTLALAPVFGLALLDGVHLLQHPLLRGSMLDVGRHRQGRVLHIPQRQGRF